MMTFVERCADVSVPAQFGKHGLHRWRRIESGSSACPLSELPLSKGTHGNTHLLPLDDALLFPMTDQFGS
jgi:hypothetical protein